MLRALDYVLNNKPKKISKRDWDISIVLLLALQTSDDRLANISCIYVCIYANKMMNTHDYAINYIYVLVAIYKGRPHPEGGV